MLRFFWFEEGFHIAVVEVFKLFCSLFKLFWVVTAARAEAKSLTVLLSPSISGELLVQSSEHLFQFVDC